MIVAIAQLILARCLPEKPGLITSTELEPLPGVVGQTRAFGVLKFGSRLDSDGFNIYVLGNPGSHRHEVVNHFLKHETQVRSQPLDWCYVNNFQVCGQMDLIH